MRYAVCITDRSGQEWRTIFLASDNEEAKIIGKKIVLHSDWIDWIHSTSLDIEFIALENEYSLEKWGGEDISFWID